MTTPLQRYNVDTVFERTWNNDGWEERLQIQESDNGDWVKWEDVQASLDALLSYIKQITESKCD